MVAKRFHLSLPSQKQILSVSLLPPPAPGSERLPSRPDRVQASLGLGNKHLSFPSPQPRGLQTSLGVIAAGSSWSTCPSLTCPLASCLTSETRFKVSLNGIINVAVGHSGGIGGADLGDYLPRILSLGMNQDPGQEQWHSGEGVCLTRGQPWLVSDNSIYSWRQPGVISESRGRTQA